MNDPVTLLGLTTTYIELAGFLLAVITVALNIAQLHWAWLFSIISSAVYAIVFCQSRLYGDMALQFVFIAVSLWGWYQWLHGGAGRAELEVTTSSAKAYGWSVAGWLAGFGVLALFLARFTDTDVPVADGFLTAGSLVGQVLLSRKKVENWIVWIIVDVLYVGLYVYKGLMLTAVLYAIFVLMAAFGLFTWYRAAKKIA